MTQHPTMALAGVTPNLPAHISLPRMPLTPHDQLPNAGTSAAPPNVRPGLVFRGTDVAKELRRGMLLKVDLSQQTTFAIRPRAGRVGILMSSNW